MPRTRCASNPCKLSGDAIAAYYRTVHCTFLHNSPGDLLGPVIHPWSPRRVNAFADFAHRLGFVAALRTIETAGIHLRGARVLDIGCGTGRWLERLARLGAKPVGIDLSVDALVAAKRRVPKSAVLCAYAEQPVFREESFDIITSVTVLQHMVPATQVASLSRLYAYLRPGGVFVLLENTVDGSSSHVFPHSAQDWVALVQSRGFKHVWDHASNYNYVMRAGGWCVHRAGAASRTLLDAAKQAGAAAPSGYRSYLRTAIGNSCQSLLALLSYPFERIGWWFGGEGTHVVGVFRK